jgi:hypothetical protein
MYLILSYPVPSPSPSFPFPFTPLTLPLRHPLIPLPLLSTSSPPSPPVVSLSPSTSLLYSLLSSSLIHTGEPLALDDVPLAVKRGLPCLYQYEDPKLLSGTDPNLKALTPEEPAPSSGVTIRDSDGGAGEIKTDGSNPSEHPLHATATATATAAATSAIPAAATTSFPVSSSASASLSGSTSKRKRITPTVVGPIGSQTHAHLLGGKVLPLSASQHSDSGDLVADSALSPAPTYPPSSSSAFTSAPTSTSASAVLSPPSKSQIAFPAISLPTAASTGTDTVEVKKVIDAPRHFPSCHY